MNELGACACGESMACEHKIKQHRITIILTHEDFRQSMGRRASNQEEFDEWAELAEKGLLNSHIDWDIIYECAEEAMRKEHDCDIANRDCVRCEYPKQ